MKIQQLTLSRVPNAPSAAPSDLPTIEGDDGAFVARNPA